MASLFLPLTLCSAAELANSITKDGITWTFDRVYPTGRFITGDPWVVGPVTVIAVSPNPGPASQKDIIATAKSRFGTTALVDDQRMRNGSMVIARRGEPNNGRDTGFDRQGYDSRPVNYDGALSIKFPYRLKIATSLISSISQETLAGEEKLATPFLPGQSKLPLCQSTLPLALRAAAVLTCLESEPPADAFRPAYAGDKVIYRRAQLVAADQLAKLSPAGPVPDWAMMARMFERPWLDHISSWLIQYTAPGENQPNYGREFARISSLAALMVLLDVPAEQKEKLLVGYVQLGIDLAGLAKIGRQWFADGGHWQGRKWPILFASLALQAPELRALPVVDANYALYGNSRFEPFPEVTLPTTLFQEDMDTYYASQSEGGSARWQIVYHSRPRVSHEDRGVELDANERTLLEAYRFNNSMAALGVALAAHTMKAKALWNHDAFFDYVDRWMRPEERFDRPEWMDPTLERSVDAFAEAMWKAHRAYAPTQPGAKDRLKWQWSKTSPRHGMLVPNP